VDTCERGALIRGARGRETGERVSEGGGEGAPTRGTLCGRVEFVLTYGYVSTQFAMKYRGDHRHARAIITGCPHLAGRCTQLPLSRSSISVSLSLSLSLSLFTLAMSLPPALRAAPFLSRSFPSRLPSATLPRATIVFLFPCSRSVAEREKSAASNEAKFIGGASRAAMTLIRLNLNRFSRFRAKPSPSDATSPRNNDIEYRSRRSNLGIVESRTDERCRSYHLACRMNEKKDATYARV